MAMSRPMTFWSVVIVLFVLMLWTLKSILLPFVLGVVIAYFLHPYADRLENKGWSRVWATITVLVSFFALGIGFFLLFLPILIEQGILFLSAIPDYLQSVVGFFKPWIEKFTNWVGSESSSELPLTKVTQKTAAVAIGFLTRIWSGGIAVLNFVGLVSITPIVAFYLLGNWPKIVKYVDDLLPRKQSKVIRKLAKEIDTLLVSFVNGTFFVCVVLALFYGGTLSLIGLKYGFTIGVAAGVISFIPYVGPIFGVVAAGGVALFQFWPHWFPLIAVLSIFLSGQLISDYFLIPRVMGNKLHLHPLWIIFGVFAGGALLGFIGMLIAVPITAVIGVLVRFSIQEYKKSPLYLGKKQKKKD